MCYFIVENIESNRFFRKGSQNTVTFIVIVLGKTVGKVYRDIIRIL